MQVTIELSEFTILTSHFARVIPNSCIALPAKLQTASSEATDRPDVMVSVAPRYYFLLAFGCLLLLSALVLYRDLPLLQCRSCKRSKTNLPYISLIVVATSATPWVDRRDRIRAQFPRNVGLIEKPERSVILKFALGTQDQDAVARVSARVEAEKHHDILLLPCLDLDDSLNHIGNWHLAAGPSATTRKVMLSVQWAVQNYNFDYFFRLGDDSYFRVDRFISLLNTNHFPDKNAVIGRMESGYVFDMQQTYPQGAGYALTYDVCLFVASNTAFLMDTAPEDCVVARWLFAVGATFVHSSLWKDMFLGESCENDMVLAHKLPAELWTNISADGTVMC